MTVLIEALSAGGLTMVAIEPIMAAIMRHCQRIVVLHHGEKIAERASAGVAHDPRVIDAYLGDELALG